MKNFKTLLSFVLVAGMLFTNCSGDDGTNDDPTDLPCNGYNKKLLTLTTVFNDSTNAVIDYDSFVINNLDPLLSNIEGSYITSSNLSFQLPTSSSVFNEANNLHGVLVTRAGKYFTFNTNTMAGQEFATLTNIAAPVLLGTAGYVIEVSPGGYANLGIDNHFSIKSFNSNNGTIGTALPISTANTTFNNNSFFNVETMSATTNGVDELYFLSGTNLITVNTTSNTASQMDLYPSFSNIDFARFFGLEYSESIGLIAIKQGSAKDLIKIDPSTGSYTTLVSIPEALNSEFYSTTYSECKKTYYLTTLKTLSNPTQTFYFEFDLVSNTISNSQLLPNYVYGIELIP